jgi:hypothetical protein
MSRLARRVAVPVTIALALIAPLVASVPAPAAPSDQDLIDLACSLPQRYLVRTWNGFSPDRGPELTAIPEEPDFMGAGLPHVGPWDYIQHIPMFWYGPGHIKAQGEVKGNNVTLADVAPTQGDILHFDGFNAPDGTPMTSALQPGENPPKLLVVLVWDSAGINVLDAHQPQWSYLRSLIPDGTWYTDAYVGSSPTSTAQDHATLGTGAFPIHHGIIAHHFQLGGQDTTPWQIGPNFFVEPTFADIYDEANDNKPVVGMVATADIHLGMLGHGTFWGGGDRDIAMARAPSAENPTSTQEGDVWNLPKFDAPYFHLPPYLEHIKSIKHDNEVLDRADGRQDGKWRENDIKALQNGFDTPARTAYQERVVETVVSREGFGADATPDLLYLNFKEIDYVGHVWSMNSPEMSDAVQYQDDALKRFVSFLDQQVGKDQWAMLITADHAAMPNPKVSGGFEISTGAVSQQIEAQFDTNGDSVSIVDNVQPGSIFLNEDEVAANHTTIDDVARFTQTLTQTDTSGGGVTPNPGQENDPVFQAVFPSSLLPELPCLQKEVKATSDIV